MAETQYVKFQGLPHLKPNDAIAAPPYSGPHRDNGDSGWRKGDVVEWDEGTQSYTGCTAKQYVDRQNAWLDPGDALASEDKPFVLQKPKSASSGAAGKDK